MKRSPLNNTAPSVRPYGARHTSYNWKSPENTSGRGYQFAEGKSYQRFPVGAGSQPCDDNFIPLNVSTPMTRHEKYNAANRYSPAGGSVGVWHNNYRGNYHATSRMNCNSRYLGYKHSPKSFHRQRGKGYKGTHRQVNVSAYIDINSFLEDPWEDLVKKLNNSKDTNKSKRSKNEFLFNSKLADDSDSAERFGSKLSTNTLDDSQCSQECKNEHSTDTSFEMQSTEKNFNQISKISSLVESEVGDICSGQDLLNESACSINDKICEATQEKNIHSSVSLIDINQKNI